MTTKVSLRKKAISNGRISLYLDFYPPIPHPETGKPTRREFLGLQIKKRAHDPLDKKMDEKTLRHAKRMQADRQSKVYDNDFSFLRKSKLPKDFLEFFNELKETKKGKTKESWSGAFAYLKKYAGSKAKFGELNSVFCAGFRDYLENAETLSSNSAALYLSKFKTALKQAHKHGLIESDLTIFIDAIKSKESKREYLTESELHKLFKTPCKQPVKNAALFSALTGLRYSDIKKLTWNDVKGTSGSYELVFMQTKTSGQEVLPISEQARQLLGEPESPEQIVFKGLTYDLMRYHLAKWLKEAGITNKPITFHCFRHTNATLLLKAGTDLYTVSKMLGHKDLRTTQIYAKVADKAKREAANRLNFEF